jgi:uncharacterized spore protein YtfJ
VSDPTNVIKALGENLHAGANVRNVYGEPVTAHGRTVIPVAQVMYGYGAGAGSKRKRDESLPPGQGGGGGGGMKATPVGALEISESGIRFLRFWDLKQVGLGLGAAFLVGMFVGRRGCRR